MSDEHLVGNILGKSKSFANKHLMLLSSEQKLPHGNKRLSGEGTPTLRGRMSGWECQAGN